ncbi:sensor histidine kinase [Sphingorhabdus pulchriflava]|uniref:Sensor histidine kinase n=1 Tax=Sphingorhabdus pulchriflava TaxID=2292257 RepID=A0A371BK52_9SPHN|nr:histidine kinase [Sphingorhabdus pulchriflava]RDV07773.1 sensor histidine kinase [Sphingorhabdus pulchriflava]
MKATIRKQRPLVGHQMAFLTIIGFWVFHAVIVSLRASVLDFPAQDELAARRAAVTLVGIILTWLLYLILRLFDRKPLGVRVATAFVAAIPCAFAIAWTNFYIFNIYDPISLFSDRDLGRRVQELRDLTGYTVWQEIAEIGVTRYFFIIAWASLYLALGYAREVGEAERTTSRYAQAAQDAELRSLRYQVNPHFLFNTLNSLSSLVIKGEKDKAEAMIQNLSTFYRTSLSSDPLEDVTIAEEVELQKQYLEIEAVRFPERLRTRIEIPFNLADYRIPALILQPLVENAIKYGVSRSTRPVTVTISATEGDGWIALKVTDDGEKCVDAEQHGNGIGLANVRDRLEARYGSAARLATEKGEQGCFRATITIDTEPKDVA